ncbi:hypothetical protein EAS68_08355 [Legionella jordanis]|nr:hypothetical protein EAS68_08355 [Legionella jordanis]
MLRKSIGFSLIELVFVMLLMSLFCFMAFPVWHSLFKKNQLEAIEHEITLAIEHAKRLALLHDQHLILRGIADDWSQGMILFPDTKDHKYHQGSKILHKWQWHYPGMQISWKGFQSNSYILFVNDLKKATTSGHFKLLTPQSTSIKLVVNRFGRVRRVV